MKTYHAYSTCSEAVNDLERRGYTSDIMKLLDEIKSSAQFKIVEVYRFEGMSSPSDNSVVYAVDVYDGRKGMIIDSYGANFDPEKEVILRSIEIVR